MKKLFKSIIADGLVFVTLFFSCMPTVHAIVLLDDRNVWDAMGVYAVDFFDWTFAVSDHVMMGANWVRSLLDNDICPNSPNADGLHNFIEKRTQIDGQIGYYYVCEYCGKSAGEVGQQVYSDYTASLPAPVYNSDGSISWKIVPYLLHVPWPNDFPGYRYENYACAIGKGKGSGYTTYVHFGLNEDFIAPVDGVYSASVITLRSLNVKNLLNSIIFTSSKVASVGSVVAERGSSNNVTTLYTRIEALYDSELSYWYGYFLIKCTPIVLDGDSYSVTTRPTTITGGNYGIVGDDGQITTVTNNSSIINETNNIYYNPATGNTGTINSWTYDYTDRSYHVTLESGDTITVTYGDEYITIVEGDVIYNIYYIIDGSGSGNDCAHEWYQTGSVQGNCLTPAQRTYTCSLCGKQYTETDPVLGHSWRIIQTVSTKYDEDGELIQEGYTLYECERCGEQYKSTNDTGPPASGGEDKDPDVDDGGLIEFFNNLIRSLSNNLSVAVDLILSFFRRIPELFGGFLDFLSAMFPFLPDDIIFLLTFGIAAVVFVGFIKAIRR